MATCGDCFYSYVDHSNQWKCRKQFGKIDIDHSACSEFLSEETHDCCDCYYCQPEGMFNTLKCKLTGKTLHDASHRPACSRFVED